MKTEDEKIRRYLLGDLAESEMREMDLRVIGEASLEEELLSAEDDLMDDYLDDLLSASDAELFRRNFLVSDERRAALRHLSRLKKYARRRAAGQSGEKSPGAPKSGWLDSLKKLFSANLRPAKVVLVVALLSAAVGVGWRLFFYDAAQGDSARAEREMARLNREDLSDLARFENIPNVNLSAGTFRGADAANRVSAERVESALLFRLALPFKTGADSLFSVRLLGGQNDFPALEGIRSYENQNGRELRILIPASYLKPGDYRIEVSGADALSSPVVYSFTVQ